MSKKTQPVITTCAASDNWTCVTFHPDLTKFGMTELDDDVVALMHKRVYDLAGVLGKGVKASDCDSTKPCGQRKEGQGVTAGGGVQVLLNGQQLPVKSFMQYVELYLEDKSLPRLHEKVNDRWEIVVAASQGQFQQVRGGPCQ